MEIVIKISEEDYNLMKVRVCKSSSDYLILDGTPLPKGHGDLIDRGEVVKSLFDYHNGKKTLGQCIEDVQTIIEADKENDNNDT